MEPNNFAAWVAQQRVLQSSDVVLGDDLIAVGKKVKRSRNGSQYEEFAITVQDLLALVSGGAVTSVFGRNAVVTAQAGDYNTSLVPELTNLYFTDARAIAAPLTGYLPGAGVVSATDTILQAIQKLDGNIATLPSGSGTLNYLSKWTPDGTTLGNSQIFDNGTGVSLGTNVPLANTLLTIKGTDTTSSNYALKVDSLSSPLLYVRNDGVDAAYFHGTGKIYMGTSTIGKSASSNGIGISARGDATWTFGFNNGELVASGTFDGGKSMDIASNSTSNYQRLAVTSSKYWDYGVVTNDFKIRGILNTDSSTTDILTIIQSGATSGNVGIGTTSPTAKLEVRTNTTEDGVKVSIPTGNFIMSEIVYHSLSGGLYRGYDLSGNLAVRLNSTSAASSFIKNSDFGVGLISPTARLHVQGVDNTSTNYSLKVDGLAPATPLLYVRNDGNIYYNSDLNLLRSLGGTNRILIGGGSANTYAVGIGSATASGDRSVAIGDFTTSSGEASVSMSYASNASGQFAIAIGRAATSVGGIVVGANSTAQAGGTAFGSSAYANYNSVAIGVLAGANSLARGTEYVSIGYTNNSTAAAIGTASTSVGSYSMTSGNQSGTFGARLSATAQGAFVFGLGSLSTLNPLVNNVAYSLIFGSNSETPTLRLTGGDGTPTSKGYVIGAAKNAAIADADLNASEYTAYLNEAGNVLTFKVKYADGVMVKTGTIALV